MIFALLFTLLAAATAPTTSRASEPKVLLNEKFENLDRWHLEGKTTGASLVPLTQGGAAASAGGQLRLDCKSKMGSEGVMAFCREDFPDNIAIEYDFLCEKHNGLFITFLAMKGVNGEDAITGVPPRKGTFEDYTGEHASTRSYHVSVCRYEDDGRHTGVSNWRRNPGLHLMVSGQDLCQQSGKTYHVKIIKQGPHCRVEVDGQRGAEFTDPQSLPGPIPTAGKFGFRAIGADAVFRVWNVKITTLTAPSAPAASRPGT